MGFITNLNAPKDWHLKFKKTVCLWSWFIFSAAFAALVATVIKMNPYIYIVRVISLSLRFSVWDATLEEKKSVNPWIRVEGIRLPNDYHFYPLCTSTHTLTRLTGNGTCADTRAASPQINARRPALCNSEMCHRASACCVRDGIERYLCRRLRRDNPFVSKFSNHLCMFDTLPRLKQSTSGTEKQREAGSQQTDEYQRLINTRLANDYIHVNIKNVNIL